MVRGLNATATTYLPLARSTYLYQIMSLITVAFLSCFLFFSCPVVFDLSQPTFWSQLSTNPQFVYPSITRTGILSHLSWTPQTSNAFRGKSGTTLRPNGACSVYVLPILSYRGLIASLQHMSNTARSPRSYGFLELEISPSDSQTFFTWPVDQ